MDSNNMELKQAEKQNSITGASNVVMAVVFIAAGGLLLLNKVAGFSFDNWWAVFMLIPISGILVKARADYETSGRISSGAIVTGGSMLLMMAVFIFDLNLGSLWPVSIVLVGLAMLFGRR